LTEGQFRHISDMGTLLRQSVTRALGGSVAERWTVVGRTVGIASEIGSKRAFRCDHCSIFMYMYLYYYYIYCCILQAGLSAMFKTGQADIEKPDISP